MISHRTHFRENDDLPLQRGLAVKRTERKPPCFDARGNHAKLCAVRMRNAILEITVIYVLIKRRRRVDGC